jgi:Tfp pilus assembly protein PilF
MMYEECLVLFRQCTLPDEQSISTTLTNLGTVCLDHGDLAAARHAFEECLAIARRREDHTLSIASNNLVNLALTEGDLATAQALLDDGIPLAEHIGATFSLMLLETNRGLLDLERGDVAAATTHLRRVLETHEAANNPIGQLFVIQTLAYIALVQHTWSEAEAWLHQAQHVCTVVGPNYHSAEVALQRSRLAMAQGDDAAAWMLVREAIQLVRVGGKRVLLPEVAEQAALLLERQGTHEQALAIWRTAASSRRSTGIPQPPSLLRWYGDQAAALLVTGSTDLPPADLDDLFTLLAALVPATDG